MDAPGIAESPLGRQNWPFPQGASVLELGTLEEAWCRRQVEKEAVRGSRVQMEPQGEACLRLRVLVLQASL